MANMKLKYEARMMMGRLSSGIQGGHGSRVHACEPGKTASYCRGKAVCGAEPGKRSAGWSPIDKELTIDCPKCLTKIGSMSYLATCAQSAPSQPCTCEQCLKRGFKGRCPWLVKIGA